MRIRIITTIIIGLCSILGTGYAFNITHTIENIFAFNNTTTETQCFDNKDNDQDGFKDCTDIDCFGNGYCSPIELNCNDKKDNNGNGHIDCADQDCKSSTYCISKNIITKTLHASPTLQEDCTNMKDDTSNGLIDCADPVCLTNSVCNRNIISELFCEDGIDNDNNGLIDCEEVSCRANQSENHCQKKIETTCNDNIDNDGDGQVDCSDTNCKLDKTCEKKNDTNDEICFDNIDNDQDGKKDCLDIDCNGKIGADGLCEFGFEKSCNDGVDNDKNGKIDCEDETCQQQETCTMSCGNGTTEGAEKCDDGNLKKGDGCYECQNEEPTCDLVIEHKNGNINIQNPYQRMQMKKLIINNKLTANSFNQKTIPIHKTGTYNIYRQVFNGEKLKQCNQTIVIKTIKGCTDETASNFNAFATYNDGSCLHNTTNLIECNVLNASSKKEDNETTYSRNKSINSTTIKGIYLVSRDGRIAAGLGGETTIIDGNNKIYPFIQVISNNGTLLSCPVTQK